MESSDGVLTRPDALSYQKPFFRQLTEQGPTSSSPVKSKTKVDLHRQIGEQFLYSRQRSLFTAIVSENAKPWTLHHLVTQAQTGS